nr:MAG TPA: hypothetical protein [Caudoviricetes sp.]
MQMVRDAKALEAIANEQGLEVEELETYGYMNDVESVVNAALEEFAGEFDTEAIIERTFGWYVPKSCYVNIVSTDAFWQIVEECELTHVDRSRTR